jgi:hypothetical protein
MDVQSFIFPSSGNSDDGTLIDSLKSILKITALDVASFANATTGTLTIELYNYTRDYSITTKVINIDGIVQDWATMASENVTGPNTVYQSVMFSGLMSHTTNYDNIWVFRIGVSDVNMEIRMNGLQKLFYSVE